MPMLETTSGVKYVSATFIHSKALARPARTLPSWFMAKKADPTMSATEDDLVNDLAAITARRACPQVDQFLPVSDAAVAVSVMC
jgi:hypothetical protein